MLGLLEALSIGELRQGLQVPGLLAAFLHGISCLGSAPDIDLGKANGHFPAMLCPGRGSAEHPWGQPEGEQRRGQQAAGGMGQIGEEEGDRSLSFPPAAGLFFPLSVSPGCSLPLLRRNGPSYQKIP